MAVILENVDKIIDSSGKELVVADAGSGGNSISLTAGEAITAGDPVGIDSNGDVFKIKSSEVALTSYLKENIAQNYPATDSRGETNFSFRDNAIAMGNYIRVSTTQPSGSNDIRVIVLGYKILPENDYSVDSENIDFQIEVQPLNGTDVTNISTSINVFEDDNLVLVTSTCKNTGSNYYCNVIAIEFNDDGSYKRHNSTLLGNVYCAGNGIHNGTFKLDDGRYITMLGKGQNYNGAGGGGVYFWIYSLNDSFVAVPKVTKHSENWTADSIFTRRLEKMDDISSSSTSAYFIGLRHWSTSGSINPEVIIYEYNYADMQMKIYSQSSGLTAYSSSISYQSGAYCGGGKFYIFSYSSNRVYGRVVEWNASSKSFAPQSQLGVNVSVSQSGVPYIGYSNIFNKLFFYNVHIVPILGLAANSYAEVTAVDSDSSVTLSPTTHTSTTLNSVGLGLELNSGDEHRGYRNQGDNYTTFFCWNGGSSYATIQVVNPEKKTIETNADTYLGIAAESATTGSPISVNIDGSMVSRTESFSVNSNVYLRADGSLSNSNNKYVTNLSVKKIGKSINSNTLLLKD